MKPNVPEPIAKDLAEVRRIVLNDLRAYAARVYLFGSHMHGTANRTSDIDVAILSLEPLPLWVLSEIRDHLEESQIPARVDLVDLSMTDPDFRQRVIREGVVWSALDND
jgi:predicted nucleotidyltransferase